MLWQEFSRTENRILGALARLDDFLMNPLFQGHSGTTPETSRNIFIINQVTNEDDSQSNPHPEADLLTSGREDRHDMATGVQRESAHGQDKSYLVFPVRVALLYNTGCSNLEVATWRQIDLTYHHNVTYSFSKLQKGVCDVLKFKMHTRPAATLKKPCWIATVSNFITLFQKVL